MWRSTAWSVAWGVLAVLAALLLAVGFGDARVALAGAGVIVALVVAWALVTTRRERRRYEEALTGWAAERAAQAERLRVATDLHDLVSHGLGTITLRASAARRVTGPAGDRERAQALADVERTSRQATTELRHVLGVLRAPGPAPLRPAESLADLPAVVEAVRGSGVRPVLHVEDLGEVPAGVQLTVCAVVREALANTARHAGPTTARVDLRRDGSVVVVEVRDDGPVPGWVAVPGAGHGLLGLRERVAAVDGTVDVGSWSEDRVPDVGPRVGGEAPAARGGFRVTARLPVGEAV